MRNFFCKEVLQFAGVICAIAAVLFFIEANNHGSFGTLFDASPASLDGRSLQQFRSDYYSKVWELSQ